MGFQNGNPLTRWIVRTPDTIANHNAIKYGRDFITVLGDDGHAWLLMAAKIGGTESLHTRAWAGVEVLRNARSKVSHLSTLQRDRGPR
eukprot:4269027-Prymnesium_polylepis.1